MGDQDLLDRDAMLLGSGAQPVEIGTGIGEGTLHRFGAPDERCILLKRGHRHDGDAERGIGHAREHKRASGVRQQGPLPSQPRGGIALDPCV